MEAVRRTEDGISDMEYFSAQDLPPAQVCQAKVLAVDVPLEDPHRRAVGSRSVPATDLGPVPDLHPFDVCAQAGTALERQLVLWRNLPAFLALLSDGVQRLSVEFREAIVALKALCQRGAPHRGRLGDTIEEIAQLAPELMGASRGSEALATVQEDAAVGWMVRTAT